MNTLLPSPLVKSFFRGAKFVAIDLGPASNTLVPELPSRPLRLASPLKQPPNQADLIAQATWSILQLLKELTCCLDYHEVQTDATNFYDRKSRENCRPQGMASSALRAELEIWHNANFWECRRTRQPETLRPRK